MFRFDALLFSLHDFMISSSFPRDRLFCQTKCGALHKSVSSPLVWVWDKVKNWWRLTTTIKIAMKVSDDNYKFPKLKKIAVYEKKYGIDVWIMLNVCNTTNKHLPQPLKVEIPSQEDKYTVSFSPIWILRAWGQCNL